MSAEKSNCLFGGFCGRVLGGVPFRRFLEGDSRPTDLRGFPVIGVLRGEIARGMLRGPLRGLAISSRGSMKVPTTGH